VLDRCELPLQLLSPMALNVDWNYIQINVTSSRDLSLDAKVIDVPYDI